MPTRVMEVWSPCKWVGIRFFVSEEGEWYVRRGTRSRRPLRGARQAKDRRTHPAGGRLLTAAGRGAAARAPEPEPRRR